MRSTLLVLLLVPAPGLATTCFWTPVTRTPLPADGARDVPVDATVRVFVSHWLPAGVLPHLGEEYRLVGPEGTVEVAASVVFNRLDLRPVRPLEANAEYRLHQLFAYRDGHLLDDSERSDPWAQPADSRRWYTVARFRTGAGRSTAPTAVAVRPAKFEHLGFDGGVRIDVPVAGNDRPLDVLEIHIEGLGVVATRPMPAGADWHFGPSDQLCETLPYSLPEWGEFKVRVDVIGPDGRRQRGAAQTVAGAPGWFELSRRRRQSGPPAGARDAAWSKPPIRQSFRSRRGPYTCPHGLEVGRGSIVRRGAETLLGRFARLADVPHIAPTEQGVIVAEEQQGIRLRTWPPRVDVVVDPRGRRPVVARVGDHHVLAWVQRGLGIWAAAVDDLGWVSEPRLLDVRERRPLWEIKDGRLTLWTGRESLPVRCASRPLGPPQRLLIAGR